MQEDSDQDKSLKVFSSILTGVDVDVVDCVCGFRFQGVINCNFWLYTYVVVECFFPGLLCMCNSRSC